MPQSQYLLVCPLPANQGTDDSQTHAPPAKRPKQGKGKGGKQHDKPQVPEVTEVPTRLETVVKLAGSTWYRAIVIQDACGFPSGRRHCHDSQRQQSEAQLRTAAIKRREAFTRANVDQLAPPSSFHHSIWPANLAPA